MRTIKALSKAVRVIGIILLAASIVLMLYATATEGMEWKAFNQELTSWTETRSKLADRFAFSRAYFQGLIAARQSQGQPSLYRIGKVLEPFDSFSKKGEQAVVRYIDNSTTEVEQYFQNEFDYEAFLTRYQQMEDRLGQAEITEIFDYLNGLSNPALKSGKVLPGLKAASQQPWFIDHYKAWQDEHGEEAGIYLDYLRTIERLIRADGKVTNAVDFTKTLSFEAYQTALADTLAEENTTDLAMFTDGFAEIAQQKMDGQEVDVPAFLRSQYELVSQRFPASAQHVYAVFLVSASHLMNDPTFDGSYSALVSRMRDYRGNLTNNLFDSYLRQFAGQVISQSDARNRVPLSNLGWWLAANMLQVGLLGIVLIILSFIMERLTTAAIIKRREYTAADEDADVLLRVNNLSQYFKSGDFVNKAVDDISFFIKKGEVFGLVGESGCGKTTTGRTIINLYDPTGGDVYFQGLRISSTKNGEAVMRYQKKKELDAKVSAITEKSKEQQAQEPERAAQFQQESQAQIKALQEAHEVEMARISAHAFESEIEKNKCTLLYREQRKQELTVAYEEDMKGLTGEAAKKRTERYKSELAVAERDNIMTKMQMIFQDPIASINPRMTVREIIAEGMMIRGIKDKDYINQKVYEMLDLVGLVQEHADRYPHEFSGGQRQRIGIARAIIMEPELIIADEPISALDVSIQAQVINLLNDLRQRMGLTIMFIAHNLSVVKYFSDRIAVMYYGRIVEMASSEDLFRNPLHPYTKSLLSAIPYPDPEFEKHRKRVTYEPLLAHDYSEDKPSLHEISPGHFVHANEAELATYRKEMRV